MIGGNVVAQVVRTTKTKNKEGMAVPSEPETLMELKGFLDYQSGQSSHLTYQAKIQDTSHLFISDYDETYAGLSENGLSLVIGGDIYEVLLIDDPMGLHQHIETYLKYVGG